MFNVENRFLYGKGLMKLTNEEESMQHNKDSGIKEIVAEGIWIKSYSKIPQKQSNVLTTT